MKRAAKTETVSIPTFADPVLVVRTCNADMTAYGGFKWPESGYIEAPDWEPTEQCGNGLHGLLEGEGDWGLLDWSVEAKGLIVEVERAGIIAIDGKIKFKGAIVKQVTTLATALCSVACDAARVSKWVADLITAEPKGADTPETVTSVDYSQLAASGDDSRLAASGDDSRLAASGYASRLAASGDDSRLAASGYASRLAASGNASRLAASGDDSRLAASGYASRLAASGNASQLAASGNASRLAASGNASRLAASGDDSRLAASGYASRLAASGNASRLAASGNASRLAASGNASQLAASGDDSRLAASGDDSVAVAAGRDSTASAGKNGVIALTWHDGKRHRVVVGYVGEDGIEPNVAYRLSVKGKFVKV